MRKFLSKIPNRKKNSLQKEFNYIRKLHINEHTVLTLKKYKQINKKLGHYSVASWNVLRQSQILEILGNVSRASVVYSEKKKIEVTAKLTLF